jgi:Ca2+-binding RTX toxin-like protein
MTNSIVLGNTAIGWRAAGDEVSRITALTGGNIVGGDLFDGAADVGDVTAAGVFAATEEIAPGVFAGVLADNGGPTRTIAIRADGPAAGAADPASATATDQRGFARDAAPDLGAFEAGAGGGGLTLVGGPGPDALTGSDFADSLRGLGGDDLLRGRGGDDLVIGGAGCDVVRGGAGDDVVRGGKGRDVIFGGLGDDVLHGGACPDRFVFRADFGDDVIADFDADPAGGQDRIDLRPLGITEASFAAEVAIVVDGGDTRIEVAGQGAIVCLGVDGIGANAVDRADFLLA